MILLVTGSVVEGRDGVVKATLPVVHYCTEFKSASLYASSSETSVQDG